MARFTIKKLVFSGRVQGVGFRFTTNEIAATYGVVGWVKNLSDGRVELVAGGTLAEVDRFIDNISKQSRLAKLIDRFDSTPVEADELTDMSAFEIRQ